MTNPTSNQPTRLPISQSDIDQTLTVLKSFVSPSGYQLCLEWHQLPYPDAPSIHWRPRQHFCNSGPSARLWIADWLVTLVPLIARSVVLSRRKVGEWEGFDAAKVEPL